jgi:hypothetical protein
MGLWLRRFSFCVLLPLVHRDGMQFQAKTAIEEAARAGFDLSLVAHSLTLTAEERALEHDGALALALELDRIRHERQAHPETAFAASR